MICQCCLFREANAKRRPLCKPCYRDLHQKGLLGKYPLLPDKYRFEQRLINKYGVDIIDAFKSVATNHDENLKLLGNKYGFTREYARQLYAKLHGFPFSVTRKYKSFNRHVEIGLRKIDPSERAKRFRGLPLIGAKSEEYVYKICQSFGFSVIPKQSGETIDFIINGYKVDVKGCTHSDKLSPDAIAQYYHFGITKTQYETVDFLICHVVPTNHCYVIPKMLLNRGGLYIPDEKTGTTKSQYANRKKSKYIPCKNAWHLLSNVPHGYTMERFVPKRSSLLLPQSAVI